MTELEKIAYAKSFIDKLVSGIDPTNDCPIPESDVAAQARIVGCFSYVSGVLGQLIDQPSITAELYKAADWHVTPELLASIECTRSFVSLSAFSKRINAALGSRRIFTAHDITPWLYANGYLEKIIDYDKKTVKRPTRKGIETGFLLEQSVANSGRVTRGIRMGYDAQCFVRDHLPQIIAYGQTRNTKVPKTTQASPFHITAQELAEFVPTEQPILISQLAYMISVLQDDENAKLKPTDLTEWLLGLGLLELVDVNGKHYKLPTTAGQEIGISTESRHSQAGDYVVALYNADAQRFIVDNIQALSEME